MGLKSYINKAANLFNVLKCLKHYYRQGGYQKVTISQINYGQILEGKKILITGGGSGIGLSIAKKCIAEGATVIISGRNIEKLRAVQHNVKSPKLHIIQWDISNITSIIEKLNEAQNIVKGEFDILVNNAGINSRESFLKIEEKEWNRVYNTNFKGLYFLTQAICNSWIKNTNDVKKIINISSTSGFVAITSPYGLSKWDINGFTKGLALSFAEKNILVNGIAPGRTATEMLGFSSAENVYDKKTPLKRYGIPEEIAEMATFLMSPAANFITGQTIICDGGRTLKD